jgi:hypothetical protein
MDNSALIVALSNKRQSERQLDIIVFEGHVTNGKAANGTEAGGIIFQIG